jgi:hypothetical protein
MDSLQDILKILQDILKTWIPYIWSFENSSSS